MQRFGEHVDETVAVVKRHVKRTQSNSQYVRLAFVQLQYSNHMLAVFKFHDHIILLAPNKIIMLMYYVNYILLIYNNNILPYYAFPTIHIIVPFYSDNQNYKLQEMWRDL